MFKTTKQIINGRSPTVNQWSLGGNSWEIQPLNGHQLVVVYGTDATHGPTLPMVLMRSNDATHGSNIYWLVLSTIPKIHVLANEM